MTRSLEKYFNIDFQSDVDGKTYSGQFMTKKLSIGERIRQGVIKTRLCEGLAFNHATQTGLPTLPDSYAEMVSHCHVALKQAPDWFKGLDTMLELYDFYLLSTVYDEVMKHERSFDPFRSRGGSGEDQEGNPQRDRSGQEGEIDSSVSDPEGRDAVRGEVVRPEVPFDTKIG